MPMLIVALSVFLAFPVNLFAQNFNAGEKPTITIGARIDGRPFIWQDRITKEYLGFFWDICTEAVTRSGYKFEAKKIDAAKRKEFLEKGDGIFDLLCDPTTITLGRMKGFIDLGVENRLRFSPIVFVANGSYIQATRQTLTEVEFDQAGEQNADCANATNAIKTQDQPEGRAEDSFLQRMAARIPIQMLPKKTPETAENRYEIWGYVEGTTSKGLVDRAFDNLSDRSNICRKPLANHADAAEEFCTGKLSRYYGDVEIVRAAIEGVSSLTGNRCEADFKPTQSGSYEPYAFVVSAKNFPTLPEQFDHALYGMFSDGTIDRLFVGHFPEKEKSQFLNTLFRINSLPTGSQ